MAPGAGEGVGAAATSISARVCWGNEAGGGCSWQGRPWELLEGGNEDSVSCPIRESATSSAKGLGEEVRLEAEHVV